MGLKQRQNLPGMAWPALCWEEGAEEGLGLQDACHPFSGRGTELESSDRSLQASVFDAGHVPLKSSWVQQTV